MAKICRLCKKGKLVKVGEFIQCDNCGVTVVPINEKASDEIWSGKSGNVVERTTDFGTPDL